MSGVTIMNLRKNVEFIALLTILTLGVTSCGGGGTSSSSPTSSSSTPENVSTVTGTSLEVIDVSNKEVLTQAIEGDASLKISLGSEQKDVYLLFSNDSSFNISSTTVTHDQSVTKPTALNKQQYADHNHENVVPSYIQAFNADLSHLKRKTEKLIVEKSEKSREVSGEISYNLSTDALGDTQLFYMDADANDAITATVKKVVTNVSTTYGLKNLTIWVENDSFGADCTKRMCITQTMLDVLADKFLKEGLDNDIYDGVSNVIGEEWGSSNYSNLIPNNDTITILLADIGHDNATNGGVIGYFYSKDNLIKESVKGSNERIMFYLDSVLYANGGDDAWDADDFWPKQIFSTLAHEFQHMIHYYQKSILYEVAETDTWINEMLSESIEDLMAVGMGLDGPRYVPANRGDAGEPNNLNGEFPLFNSNNAMVLESWDNSLEDYSKVASFGAYLLRNYGGAKLLNDIVHNRFTDKEAIVYAVNQHPNGGSKTFDDLVHDWGVAVLLSKNEHLNIDSGLVFNTGDYISSQFNGLTYDLGSINFFNYTPTPSISNVMGTVNANANYYYRVGDNLTGDLTVSIKQESGLTTSLVIVE